MQKLKMFDIIVNKKAGNIGEQQGYFVVAFTDLEAIAKAKQLYIDEHLPLNNEGLELPGDLFVEKLEIINHEVYY